MVRRGLFVLAGISARSPQNNEILEHLKTCFLDQSIPKLIYSILKTNSLVGQYLDCLTDALIRRSISLTRNTRTMVYVAVAANSAMHSTYDLGRCLVRVDFMSMSVVMMRTDEAYSHGQARNAAPLLSTQQHTRTFWTVFKRVQINATPFGRLDPRHARIASQPCTISG